MDLPEASSTNRNICRPYLSQRCASGENCIDLHVTNQILVYYLHPDVCRDELFYLFHTPKSPVLNALVLTVQKGNFGLITFAHVQSAVAAVTQGRGRIRNYEVALYAAPRNIEEIYMRSMRLNLMQPDQPTVRFAMWFFRYNQGPQPALSPMEAHLGAAFGAPHTIQVPVPQVYRVAPPQAPGFPRGQPSPQAPEVFSVPETRRPAPQALSVAETARPAALAPQGTPPRRVAQPFTYFEYGLEGLHRVQDQPREETPKPPAPEDVCVNCCEQTATWSCLPCNHKPICTSCKELLGNMSWLCLCTACNEPAEQWLCVDPPAF